MKKFFAMMMAGVMTLSMGVTAFAEEVPDPKTHKELEFTGELQDLAIEVTLPTTPALVINPYKLAVEDPYNDGEKTNSQFLGADTYVFSTSNVALRGDVAITGVIPEGSGATFTTSDQKTKPGKAKDVYMFARVSEEAALGEEFTEYGAAAESDTVKAVSAAFDTETAYDKSKDLMVGTTEAKLESMFTLHAVEFEEDAATDANFVAIRLCGNVNDKSPTAWTEADTVNVTMVFDFLPVALDEEAGD